MKERRYDIDWMRVNAMLRVFALHCTRFFCTEDWHVTEIPRWPLSQNGYNGHGISIAKVEG